MTTQTNRIAIALCESAGVKPYYPGKVNRWQWESYLPEARRLVEVFKPDPDIERDRWLAMEALNGSRVASGLGGLVGINQSNLFQGHVVQTAMMALPSDQSGSFVADTPKRKWWQLW